MLGKLAAATSFAAVISLGVGAWSYAPSADRKPWRPPVTAVHVAMPADQLPVPPRKAKPIPMVMIGQSTKTAAITR
jgi:hypothetical protein